MPWRDYILDRFWLKLFSFILATLIWFTIHNVQMESQVATNPFRRVESREFDRMVRIATLPTNRRLFKVEPVQVRITVRGNASVLDRIKQSDLQPYVVLTDALDSPAPYAIDVKTVPANVKVERVSPSTVIAEPLRPN
jgi:YbbR domain-containing protein